MGVSLSVFLLIQKWSQWCPKSGRQKLQFSPPPLPSPTNLFPPTTTSRPSGSLMVSAAPLVVPSLPGVALTVTVLPILEVKSALTVPLRFTAMGEAPSNVQVVTLPLASLASTQK